MITHISIKNFALIDDISIDVNRGFTVITGETGSGKSILLGALGLILGERADLDSIKDQSKKCIIETSFSIKDYQLKTLFEELDLDYEDDTIIRREILPSGKSRAFVNDSPVKLQTLKKLGISLIDIHSQHETLAIGKKEVQYKCLDLFAKNEEIHNKFKHKYILLNQLKTKYSELNNKQKEINQAHDYNLFLLQELDEAQLSPGLQDKLEEQQQELSNVELLKEQLSKALQLSENEEAGTLEQLRETYYSIDQLNTIKPIFRELSERIKSIQIELEDIVVEINRQVDQIEDDPHLLEQVNTKLNKIYQLQKKHQVDSVEELIRINSQLADQVLEKDQLSEQIESVNKQIEEQYSKLVQQANHLFNVRSHAIPKLEKELKNILSRVGMPNATFKLELSRTENLSSYGMDELVWKFSANQGSVPKPIEKVASGGELSRISLAVKRILAENSKLPSIIFDEIDTGVSGDIGSKIGEILSEMGRQMQVISISHLPQLAAQAKHHLKVFKTVNNKNTSTKISQLTDGEKLNEIVNMLGADTNSKSAVEHAKSLLNG